MENTERAGESDSEPTAVVEGAPVEAERDDAEPGPTGRYVVIDHLGAGGMGTVWRAYDPKLQREVALKRLHRGSSDRDEARLVREARAMAQLSHGNVVAVYDVEQSEDGVLLAMEYIRGATLSQWLRATDRGWREILATLIAAGRGLEAAHRAGLVHRDFKPSNVLVGDDGRVKVGDFGLARAAASIASLESRSESGGARPGLGPLTRADSIVGTPHFMAPEQLAGEPVKPTVDQYAFCVTAWAALTGASPFSAQDMEELAQEKAQGRPTWPSAVSGVPARVRSSLARGLSPDPGQRFADMEALLGELSATIAPRARVWTGAALAGVVLVVGFGVWDSHEPSPVCSGAEARITETWGEAQRGRVREALQQAGGDEGAWERVGPVLDAWASEWTSQHTEACEATRLRREQSETLMDLKMGCLQTRREGFVETVELLTAGEAQTMHRSAELTASLPSLDRCRDAEALQSVVAPPEDADDAAVVARVRGQLERAAVLETAARLDEVEAILEGVEPEVTALGYGPLAAEVALMRGKVELSRTRFDASIVAFREAMGTALAEHHDAVAAEAAAKLAFVIGNQQRHHEIGLWMYEAAAPLAKRTGDARLEALAEGNLGTVYVAAGRFEDAVAAQERAIARLIEAYGPDHHLVANKLNDRANALRGAGHIEEAVAGHREALARFRRTLGPNHPAVVTSLSNLSSALDSAGQLKEALELTRQAVDLVERVREPGDALRGLAYVNLAMRLDRLSMEDEARDYYRRALGIFESAYGAGDHRTLTTRFNLAGQLEDAGEHDEAEREFLAVLDGRRKLHPDDHPDVAIVRYALGRVARSQGRKDVAVEYLEDAFAIYEATVGADHPEGAGVRCTLGYALLDVGRRVEAMAALEGAWSYLGDLDGIPDRRARCGFILAQTLYADPASRDRALEIGRRVAAIAGEAEHGEKLRRDIDEWLADPHPLEQAPAADFE